MRAPALLARAGAAGRAPSPPTSPLALWLKSYARPCGSSLTLAPVDQDLRSPPWLKSHARPCGSTLAGVGMRARAAISTDLASRPCGSSLTLAPVAQPSPLWLYSGRRRAVPNCHWSWVSSRAACWCAGSPARIATVVLVGCSGAGSGRGCRTWIAVCTVFSGARRRSEPALSCARIAGPSQCGGSPAPRGCASLGVTGLSAANQSPISMAPLRLLSRPSWRPGRAGLPDARARAVTELVGTVRVSLNSCPPHPLASGPTMLATSPGQWPAHLRQILADSDAGPGSRISRPPRPEVTIRHVPIPSPLLALARSRPPDSSRVTITFVFVFGLV
jgi:hypothetical protein